MNSSKYKKAIKRCFFRIINLCLSVFPVRRNRVFFLSFYGNSYSDNPKAISEALYDLYGNEYDYIWVVVSESIKKSMPKYVKTCRYNSVRMVYYMATSKVWVSNFCLPKGTYKKKEQYYIQTWHGDKAFKKIMHDVPSRDGSEKWLFETDNANLMTAGSKYGESQFRTAFLYNGEVLKCGTPRNDIFFKDTINLQKHVRYLLGLKETDKIVLYAPTFRRENKKGLFEAHFDFSKSLKILEDVTGDKWKMMVRMHSADKRDLIGMAGMDCLNVSDYPETNELLLITDILITDFSSIAGDFALSYKPIILFLYNMEDYLLNDRELYFDVSKSPYMCTTKEEGLYDFLENIKHFNPQKNCSDILEFYGDLESGKSSRIVAEKINTFRYKK